MTRPVMYEMDKRDLASPELRERVYMDLKENGPSIFDEMCKRVNHYSCLGVAAAIGILRTEDRVTEKRPKDRNDIFEWLRLTTYSAV